LGKSLAICYKSISGGTSVRPDLDLHFNLWGGYSKNDKESFLDIGLKIADIIDIASLDIMLPVQLDKSNVSDLGGIISRDNQLLISIFNENYHTNTNNTLLREVFLGPSNTTKFYIREVTINEDRQQNEIDVLTYRNQSTVRLKKRLFDSCRSSLNGLPIYIRLRVNLGKKLNVFCQDYGPNTWFRRVILNQFQKTHFVDFRINETRNLDSATLNQIFSRKKGFFNITDIRLFIVRGIEYEYISSNKETKYLRQLESELWTKYVFGKSNRQSELKGLLAHYWHSQPSISNSNLLQDFYVFAKYKKSEIHITYLLLFVVLSGLLVNLIYDVLKGNYLTKLWLLIEQWLKCTPPPA